MRNPYLPQDFRDHSTGTLKKTISGYRRSLDILEPQDELYKFVAAEYLKEAISAIEDELKRREDA